MPSHSMSARQPQGSARSRDRHAFPSSACLPCLPTLPALAHLRCPSHPCLPLPALPACLTAGLRVGGGMRANTVVSHVSRVVDGMRDPCDATSVHFAYTLDAQAYLKRTGGRAKEWVVGAKWRVPAPHPGAGQALRGAGQW